MISRATVDVEDGALFVKDGVPVKFCFHKSVTQGRSRITRDIERHGGEVVTDERLANVLLVDEQEDLAFIRRRYYSSTELYRLSIYIEPRGFVQTCIRARTYCHVGPVKRGMPGRALVGSARGRVPFTEEDRDHLAYYLATRCPTQDGRMGNSAYKDLERMGQTEDRSWSWARRHTFHSWREHYKMNPQMMNARIDFYLQRLKGVGHHFGHDTRTHGHWDLRQELREEDEENEEEGIEPEQQDRARRDRVHPAPPGRRSGRAARDYLARHGRNLVDLEEEDDDTQEVAMQELQRVKHHHIHSGAHRQRDTRMTQAKRTHVSDVPVNERRTLVAEAGRGDGSPARGGTDREESSQDIEGGDLFGDRAYKDEQRFDFDDVTDLSVPLSPTGASLTPDQNGRLPSTQATLSASSFSAEKGSTVAHVRTQTKVPEATDPSMQSGTMQETFKDEMVVEELLEGSVENEGDEDDESSHGEEIGDIIQRLPRFQMVEMEGELSDSDDVETHTSLVRDGVREASVDDAEETRADQDQDQTGDNEESNGDDADQIERRAGGSLYTSSRRRVTRSMTARRKSARVGPGNQARAAPRPTTFPSPGTKARAVVDRFRDEGRRMLYVPPPGTRAAKARKGKGG